MDLKTIITSALVATVLATGFGVILNKKPELVAPLGALTGPDIPSSYLNWGGVRTYNFAQAPVQATTTICALQSPSATSTLEHGGVILEISSTTASVVTIAKATTAFATTTLINSASVAANAQATIIAASTTLSTLEQTNRTFAPNTWLVFGMSGGTGTMSPTGRCQASFIEYPRL